jgi:hypothetical protein
LIVKPVPVDGALGHAARVEVNHVVLRFQKAQSGGAVAWIERSLRTAGYVKDIETLFFAEIETVAEKIGQLEFAGRRLFPYSETRRERSDPPAAMRASMPCLSTRPGSTHLAGSPRIRPPWPALTGAIPMSISTAHAAISRTSCRQTLLLDPDTTAILAIRRFGKATICFNIAE